AEELALAIAPFAKRERWPPPPEDSAPHAGGLSSTLLAPEDSVERAAPVATDRGSTPPAPRRRAGVRAAIAGALAIVAIVVAVTMVRRATAPTESARPFARARPHLDPGTLLLNTEPLQGAVQQIEALTKARAFRDAALLNAMVATPSAFWFEGALSPQQVEADARSTVARGARQGRVPVLVTYNHPFRDCTGYGVSGATDTAAYRAWIEGFATGIGNEKAIVILEPNSLGLMPYGKALDGEEDACKPTIADVGGKRIVPPGASPSERYGQLALALDALARKAPNAAVYLDGTHSNWLSVGEAAYRLTKAGVDRAAGFYLNVGHYQPTRRLIQFGTWVAKCIEHAKTGGGDPAPRFKECASPGPWADVNDDPIWTAVDAWYAAHVDTAVKSSALTHFVINTNRNGRGPLAFARYAESPFNQPPAVVEGIRNGSWCMPPGRGVGIRPTADTRVPLVDAYLWTHPPGISIASCDIAGGARAWDYAKYNPWGIAGDAQNHFDPLWGMVVPPTGAWFPEEALQLARNADPPLAPADEADETKPSSALATTTSTKPTVAARASGRPGGRPGERPARPAGVTAAPDTGSASAKPAKSAPTAATFDPENPYK
ncbi:MAG TPA: glycoside hydrolase family 6 protein, partial [Polyangia bacterium]|nr:glycoside hydrolase family 6 protein [Polyangia bacterium]